MTNTPYTNNAVSLSTRIITGLRDRVGSKKAFTLVELLIVILIIGILLAIALPTFLNQQKKGQDVAAKSTLRTAYTYAKTEMTDSTTSPNLPDKAVYISDLEAGEPELAGKVVARDSAADLVSTDPSTKVDKGVLAVIKSQAKTFCAGINSQSGNSFVMKTVDNAAPTVWQYAGGATPACDGSGGGTVVSGPIAQIPGEPGGGGEPGGTGSTPMTLASISTRNTGGGTNGLAETGDQVIYGFSGPLNTSTVPQNVADPGWTGASPLPVCVYIGPASILAPTAGAGSDNVLVVSGANQFGVDSSLTVDLGSGSYMTPGPISVVAYGSGCVKLYSPMALMTIPGSKSMLSVDGNNLDLMLGTMESSSNVPMTGTPTKAAAPATLSWTMPACTPGTNPILGTTVVCPEDANGNVVSGSVSSPNPVLAF